MAIFYPASEAEVSAAILEGFTKELREYLVTDAIVVGAGPSGLVCARGLAQAGHKVLVLESNNYIGGGFWIGGYLMNKVTFRAPSQEVLDELGIPYTQAQKGLYVADGPHACSKLIAAACDAGVKILNMTKLDDLVVKKGVVCGTVINWTPVGALPRAITCVDPIALESKLVIDATGHDAHAVMALERRGLYKTKGMGVMDVVSSEDAIVEHTGVVFPGLIVTGMSVSTTYGLPRMGPTFGGMLLSGKKAAEVAISLLEKKAAELPRVRVA